MGEIVEVTVAELRAKHNGLPCYYVYSDIIQERAKDTDCLNDKAIVYLYGAAPWPKHEAFFPKMWTNRLVVLC